jgi:hypothetical protein
VALVAMLSTKSKVPVRRCDDFFFFFFFFFFSLAFLCSFSIALWREKGEKRKKKKRKKKKGGYLHNIHSKLQASGEIKKTNTPNQSQPLHLVC